MAYITIEYFEDLSATGVTCLPTDAFKPDGKKEYFRVVKHNPAISDCFISHRAKFPTKVFKDECEARAVSLTDSLEGLINGYFKIPAHKKKNHFIGSVKLKPQDGLLKQTFAAGHHAWWRSPVFEPSSANIQTIAR